MGKSSSRGARVPHGGSRALVLVTAVLMLVSLLPGAALAQGADPRNGLAPGLLEGYGEASSNMENLAHLGKPAEFFNPASPGSLSFANSDLAFWDTFAAVGNFHGFNIYDISDPANPTLRTSVVCPGGQGDVAVHGSLLFMSVEETRGRVDCGTEGNPGGAQESRFRGVRIFDISDVDNPVQLRGIQTCKGSHTFTLVEDPADDAHIYVYVSGTAGIRNAAEEPGGCAGTSSLQDPDTDNFSISIAKVPLANPSDHVLVNRNARVFSTCGDNSCQDEYADGALNGLPGSGAQPTYPPDDPRAPGGQSRSQTFQCHDITAYSEIGLAAGACQGHGILLDISDPANPRRIDAVEDYNFAYWHSATFNNDGTKVVFTDEWGGGVAARCRVTDPDNWGADAIFDIVQTADGPRLQFASYYKIPNVQASNETCVAHNGSLVPVPGRDIMVQAWYQGGVSVWDFTDSSNPVEIAFFDRGPYHPTIFHQGGYWSVYYYDGHIYGNEIFLGFDAFELTPSELLSRAEIDAAAEAGPAMNNAQTQSRLAWEPSFNLVRATSDQLVRSGDLAPRSAERVEAYLERAERFAGGPQAKAAANHLDAAVNVLTAEARAGRVDRDRVEVLADHITDLADTLR